VFSTAALNAIADLRSAWNAEFIEKADVVAIGWANEHRSGKHVAEGVAISFFDRNERPGIVHAIQKHQGLDVIFGAPASDSWRFERKTVDFTPERRFFLR
jgi:hypothetical protein